MRKKYYSLFSDGTSNFKYLLNVFQYIKKYSYIYTTLVLLFKFLVFINQFFLFTTFCILTLSTFFDSILFNSCSSTDWFDTCLYTKINSSAVLYACSHSVQFYYIHTHTYNIYTAEQTTTYVLPKCM